jgi:predicted ATPase
MKEAISLARAMKDTHALAMALLNAGLLGHFEHHPQEVERVALEVIELSTRHNFSLWQYAGEALRGWARSACGDITVGLALIERGMRDLRAAGWMLCVPYSLSLKAEALHLADRTSEALETIGEAEAVIERSEERWWCAELYRLRGVFLTAMDAKEAQIEASFCEAIRIAREQKSISLAIRAEASYTEYRDRKGEHRTS